MKSKVLGLLGLGAILALTGCGQSGNSAGASSQAQSSEAGKADESLKGTTLICILGTVCSHRKCWTALQKRQV